MCLKLVRCFSSIFVTHENRLCAWHPSAVVEVVSEDQFRVHCISTGGRVLNMSITGPHGVVSPLSDIQAVGNQTWMGNDGYVPLAAGAGNRGINASSVLSSWKSWCVESNSFLRNNKLRGGSMIMPQTWLWRC